MSRGTFLDHQLSRRRPDIDAIIDFLDLYILHKSQFDIVADQLDAQRDVRELLKLGLFDAQRVIDFHLKLHNLTSTTHSGELIRHALQRLVEYGLIERLPKTSRGDDQFRPINASANIWSRSLAENICYSIDFLIDKYRPSIPFIEVRLKNGDLGIGTGFLLRHPSGQCFIITNKHVAEGEQIDTILAIEAEGHAYGWTRLTLSSRFDLAAIDVTPPPGAHGFIVSRGKVLQDVIAFGYPKIAVAEKPFLMAHRGQINGNVVNKFDRNEYHAISCSVAPGNSGGPIILEHGGVVGVVVQSSEFRSASDVVGIHHLAVPADSLIQFLTDEVHVGEPNTDS